jgi:hypothetical protein
MGIVEQLREWRDFHHDLDYKSQILKFREACRCMESPDCSLEACLNVLKYRPIDAFYGKKSNGFRCHWAIVTKEHLTRSFSEDEKSTISLITDTLSTERQINLISELYEQFSKEDTTWLEHVLTALTNHHRECSDPDVFKTFRMIVVRSSGIIPPGVINASLPEIDQERKRMEAAIPPKLHRLMGVFKAPSSPKIPG